MSDRVENPEDRFSRVAAQFTFYLPIILSFVEGSIICQIYADGSENSVIGVVTLLIDVIGCCIIP